MSFWGERRFDEESIKQRSTRFLIPCASVLCSFCRGWLCCRHWEWTSEVVAGVIVKNGCGAKKRCWDVTQLNLRGSVSPHPKPGGRRASLTRKRRNSTQTITIFNKIIKLFSRHYCNNPTTNLPAVIEDSLKNQGGVRWSRPPLNLFHNMLQP